MSNPGRRQGSATSPAAEAKRLTTAEALRDLALTPLQVETLDRIANGEKVPGAREIIQAARLKIDIAMVKSTELSAMGAPSVIEINCPYCLGPEGQANPQ